MITNSCKPCTAGTFNMCIVFIEQPFVMKIIFFIFKIVGGLLCCQSQLYSDKKNLSKIIFRWWDWATEHQLFPRNRYPKAVSKPCGKVQWPVKYRVKICTFLICIFSTLLWIVHLNSLSSYWYWTRPKSRLASQLNTDVKRIGLAWLSLLDHNYVSRH